MVVLNINTASTENVLRNIEKMIANPPETSLLMVITPEVAAALLKKRNRHNRPPKPKNIDRYVKDMEAGEWVVTGDTVKFSNKGLLRDGQNRLTACVKAKKPFETHVIFGIDDGYFDRMDCGKARTASDLLTISGYQNTHILNGAVRWTHLIKTGRVKNRGTFSSRETLQLLQEKYPRLSEFSTVSRQLWKNTGQPTTVTTALLYLFDEANPIRQQEFCDAWVSGKWTGRFRMLKFMQDQIRAMHALSLGRVHEVTRVAIIINAWNMFVSGNVGKKEDVLWNSADDFPQILGC